MRIMVRLCILVLLTGFSSHAQQLDTTLIKNLAIRNIGPANMSGRITAIDVVVANTKVMYVGAASGGVWKSENGGSAWRPIFDDQPTQNIGSIAIQQSNPDVVWVGTGEGNPRNSMNLGMGIFKSLDAGKTWRHMGLEATKAIHRIIVHPDNPDVVYAGAIGDPFTPNENRGLYKTSDGGKTWIKILYSNSQSGIGDLVMDPSNSNKMFAALYEHRRTPYYFTSGGEGSGIFVTHDGGTKWKQLGAANGLPNGPLGRVGIAISPSNPQRVYAKIEATKNALYRSDDGGDHWYMVNDNPRFTNNRPFYFQDLAVDSKDPNRLYNIYQPLTVSYDGGKTFDPTPMIPADETKGIHADFHAFWMNPNDPKHFIIGGDGGIGITHDHGAAWYFPETIPVAQFYHVNVDHETPYNVYGGMQDNGNWSGPGYVWKRGGIRTLYWQYLVGGDGFYIAPDKDNARFGFGTSQNGELYRYDKLTGYYQSVKPHVSDPAIRLRFNWNAAFAKDPFDDNAVYYGSQFVHYSNDKGRNWKILSPDLTTNNPEHQKSDYGGLTLDVSGAEMYNSILTIAPSAVDKKIIWVGTDDGQIQLSRDGGTSWNNVTASIKGIPKEAWVAQIHASRYHAGTAWVIVNNYRKGDYAPYLFKTDNYGKTWTRLIDGIKVKGYALSVLQDPVEPKLVFLGTEQGLWISIDEGNSWTQFNNGFPSVSTMDLVIQEKESALIVGTFGRSIWILDDLLSLREVVKGKLNRSITAFPMNNAVQVKGLFIAPPGNIWTGFHTTFEGENRVFQKVKIPFYLNDKPDTVKHVVAEIYAEKSELINTVSAMNLNMGLNYLEWKLDEKATTLTGAWASEESRGIPVLPGVYTIILKYGNVSDTTQVQVVTDPRFNLDPGVDVELHAFQKAVDREVERLSALLISIDLKMESLSKLENFLKEKPDSTAASLLPKIKTLKTALTTLRAKGQTPRPSRQVGAWQSFETSAYSKVQDALSASKARTTIPSDQDLQLVTDAKQLIDSFEGAVNRFMESDWVEFKNMLDASKVEWVR